MALPSSGQISMGDINVELGRSRTTVNTSLAGGTTPTVGSLFGLASSAVNKTAPHRISEFYGYSNIIYYYYTGPAYYQDPCFPSTSYDIYSASDGKMYAYNGSSYVLASSISTNWYIYQYFDDAFWLYVYAHYKATTSSFIYFGDYYSSCAPF